VVTPLAAYFDASGSEPQSSVWTVGGRIGTVAEWSELNIAWQKMLDEAPFRADVEQHKRVFHAADLEYREATYSGWTEAEKQSFQDEAYSIIEQFPSFTAISSSLIKADWESLGLQLDTVRDGHPGNFFVHVILDALSNIRKWADAEAYDGPIQYYFEAGDIGMGNVQDALKRIDSDPKRRQPYRMEGWHFEGKQLLPLQAADIWAYESYKQMLNRIVAGQLRKRRYPFNRLWQERYTPYNTYADRERLEGLIAKARAIEAKKP